MESSASGLAALALCVLCLGFWVPHRLRLRQQLADSRVDDRFSAGLRVLAVADGAGVRPVSPATGSGESVPLLARVSSSDVSGGERPMGHEDRNLPRRGAVSPAARASRLAQLTERAARARRRLVLTLLLGLATAAAWVLVAVGLVGWYAGAVPSALLLVVLVMGRVAAMSARRADARWTAERRSAQRRATQARALANGGPYAPRNRARVTGHAVRGSTTHTQMIPRVSAPSEGPVNAAARRVGARPGTVSVDPSGSRREATPAPVGADAEAAEPERAQAPSRVEQAEERSAAPAETPAGADVPAPAPARTPPRVGTDPWEPVPVPLPTYVTKPAAPRPFPGVPPTAQARSSSARLAATMHGALGPTATPARATDETACGEDRAAGDAAPPGQPAAGDEPRPRTETLGLPLEEILARRRAAG